MTFKIRHPLIAKLRARRLFVGKTQEELSLEMGFGQEVVSDWERGRNFPKLDNLEIWVSYLSFELVLVSSISKEMPRRVQRENILKRNILRDS